MVPKAEERQQAAQNSPRAWGPVGVMDRMKKFVHDSTMDEAARAKLAFEQAMVEGMVAQGDYHMSSMGGGGLFPFVVGEAHGEAPRSADEMAAHLEGAAVALGKRKRQLTPVSKRKKPARRPDGPPSPDKVRTKALLTDRGVVGELPLHMAGLFNKPEHWPHWEHPTP